MEFPYPVNDLLQPHSVEDVLQPHSGEAVLEPPRVFEAVLEAPRVFETPLGNGEEFLEQHVKHVPYDRGGAFAPNFCLPGMSQEKVPLDCWLDMTAYVQCGNCLEVMDHSSKFPCGGRCGHIICSDCLLEINRNSVNFACKILPCPYKSCQKPMSFERGVKNQGMLDCFGRLMDMRSKCIELASNQVQQRQEKDNAKLIDCQKRLECLKRRVAYLEIKLQNEKKSNKKQRI